MRLERWLELAAATSFVLCLLGGAWLLFHADPGKDALSVAIGLYFVGKAFFVGPALLAAAEQLRRSAR